MRFPPEFHVKKFFIITLDRLLQPENIIGSVNRKQQSDYSVKSELLSDADRSHKCDSQEKVCWTLYLLLDKGHFITVELKYPF